MMCKFGVGGCVVYLQRKCIGFRVVFDGEARKHLC